MNKGRLWGVRALVWLPGHRGIVVRASFPGQRNAHQRFSGGCLRRLVLGLIAIPLMRQLGLRLVGRLGMLSPSALLPDKDLMFSATNEKHSMFQVLFVFLSEFCVVLSFFCSQLFLDLMKSQIEY